MRINKETIKGENLTKTISRKLGILSMLMAIITLSATTSNAQEYLRLYCSAPGQMESNVTGGTLTTEDFNDFSPFPNSTWATTPGGFTSEIGTYYQTSGGDSFINVDNQYGAGTGDYLSIETGGKVNLVFNSSVTYFGFAWPAGDGSNTINIKRNGVVIGTFSTSNIIGLLPKNPPNMIATVNGPTVSTDLYYGKPGTNLNINEPYSYLHFVSSVGLAFDEIELTMGDGGNFENDNHAIINTLYPNIQGDWVLLASVRAPVTLDDSKTGLFGQSVKVKVLANDIPGDAPIDPASINIVGSAGPGASLVVANEGIWTINNNNKIKFTPEAGYTGDPTPIEYYVMDTDNISSNISTVTIIYNGPTNLYPATGPGTLGFEDLWPAKGDYDFNDLVIDYQFEINSNVNNYVEDMTATFTIKAFGAGFENGFGFQLAASVSASNLTVSGYDLQENIINLETNGTESGQANATIIVYDNAFKQMTHPGVGIGVNTDPTAPYVSPVTIVITMVFTPNTTTYNDLDIGNFNPFIFVDKDRSVEVHLPNYPPTSLANQALFGVYDDSSDASSGRYYKTESNLPWAINIYESFDYPSEKQAIVNAHLKFADWAISSGTQYQDWYKDLPQYRNESLIYQIQP